MKKMKVLSAITAMMLTFGTINVSAAPQTLSGTINVSITIDQHSIEIDPGTDGDIWVDPETGTLNGGYLSMEGSATEEVRETLKLYGIKSSSDYVVRIKEDTETFVNEGFNGFSSEVGVEKNDTYGQLLDVSNLGIEIEDTGEVVYFGEDSYIEVASGEFNPTGNNHDLNFVLDPVPGYPSGLYRGSLTISIMQQ